MTTTAIHENAALAATTETAIYTVAAGKRAVISTIKVINRTAGDLVVNVYATTATGAATTADWITPTLTIAAYDSYSMTEGYTLKAAHQIRAYASAAGLSIVVCGMEQDA